MEQIPIKGLENYMINENGEVYSKLSGKFLKPIIVGEKYSYVSYGLKNTAIGQMKFYKAHRLCMVTFNGAPPSSNRLVLHVDGNTLNNHISNLVWGMSNHGNGIDPVVPDGLANRIASANAISRRVRLTKDDKSTVVDSVGMAAKKVGTYREKIYRYNGKTLNGYQIELI